jgi:hypothetical protein
MPRKGREYRERAGCCHRDGEHDRDRRLEPGGCGKTKGRDIASERGMPGVVSGSVGSLAPPHHGECAAKVGNCGDEAGANGVEPECVDDLRQPEAEAVKGENNPEIGYAEQYHVWVA